MKKAFFLCLYLYIHLNTYPQQPVSTINSLNVQSETINTKSLTVDDGLPQGFVNGILQDALGFMWMGTRDGLARYDGRSVKVFRNDVRDSNSISSNVFNTIYLDNRNKIWII